MAGIYASSSPMRRMPCSTLAIISGSPSNSSSGVHRPAWTIFMRHRRTEQRHDPVARVLVDRALEAVHLGCNAFETAVDDVVHDLRVECSASVVKPATSANRTVTCLHSP